MLEKDLLHWILFTDSLEQSVSLWNLIYDSIVNQSSTIRFHVDASLMLEEHIQLAHLMLCKFNEFETLLLATLRLLVASELFEPEDREWYEQNNFRVLIRVINLPIPDVSNIEVNIHNKSSLNQFTGRVSQVLPAQQVLTENNLVEYSIQTLQVVSDSKQMTPRRALVKISDEFVNTFEEGDMVTAIGTWKLSGKLKLNTPAILQPEFICSTITYLDEQYCDTDINQSKLFYHKMAYFQQCQSNSIGMDDNVQFKGCVLNLWECFCKTVESGWKNSLNQLYSVENLPRRALGILMLSLVSSPISQRKSPSSDRRSVISFFPGISKRLSAHENQDSQTVCSEYIRQRDPKDALSVLITPKSMELQACISHLNSGNTCSSFDAKSLPILTSQPCVLFQYKFGNKERRALSEYIHLPSIRPARSLWLITEDPSPAVLTSSDFDMVYNPIVSNDHPPATNQECISCLENRQNFLEFCSIARSGVQQFDENSRKLLKNYFLCCRERSSRHYTLHDLQRLMKLSESVSKLRLGESIEISDVVIAIMFFEQDRIDRFGVGMSALGLMHGHQTQLYANALWPNLCHSDRFSHFYSLILQFMRDMGKDFVIE